MSQPTSSRQDEFAKQFIANQGRLYGFIATMLPHRDDAEEVLQRTSLVLWQKWDSYESTRPFLPWARGIAHHEIRNLLRRSERRNVHLSEPIVEMLAAEFDDEGAAERTEALSACLEQLKPKQRHLLEQCYLGPHGINAVAEAMNSTAAAVYMRLHRMRKILVECINRRMAQGLAQ